jgi:hypothetical protein
MRIYKIISSFKEEDTAKGLNKLPKVTQDMLIELVRKYEFYDFKYDGKVCHWSKGDMELSIGFCPVEYVREIKKWDDIIHEGVEGYTHIYDITDEVLYSRHDMEVYGFFKEELMISFDDYIVEYITKDIILDKINLYGVESLTENDKRILNDQPYKKFIDTFIEND